MESRIIESHPNYRIYNDGTVRNSKDEIKTPYKNKHGYMTVNLYNNGKSSSKRIHRLVAEAFIPNPYNKPEVNHLDGNKTNNYVGNLEWSTKSENMQHAYKTGLNKPHATYGMRGHKNPNGGRKGRPVTIIETNETFDSVKDCANAINGSDRRICDCLNGKMDEYLGYHYR